MRRQRSCEACRGYSVSYCPCCGRGEVVYPDSLYTLLDDTANLDINDDDDHDSLTNALGQWLQGFDYDDREALENAFWSLRDA